MCCFFIVDSYCTFLSVQLSASLTFTERRKDIERLSCAGKLCYNRQKAQIMVLYFLGFLTEFNINSLNAADTNTMDLADEYMQVSERAIIIIHMSSGCFSLVMDRLGLQTILRHHGGIALILSVTC